MKKYFVTDTCTLIDDPLSIFSFQDNTVIIPIVVIEELDSLKKGSDAVARNAREVIRHLDALRERGNLADGVPLNDGGILKIELNHRPENTPSMNKDLSPESADNRILSVALGVKEGDAPVILVTNDANLRVKANALGVTAEDYKANKVQLEEKGIPEISVSNSDIQQIFDGVHISAEGFYPLMPNQCVLLKSPKSSALMRYTGNHFIPVHKLSAWGISPKNLEQQVAMDLLLDDNIKVVCLMGIAGSGKTLLSLAAGLDKSTDGKMYSKLIVARPTVPMGRDIGYLPGELDEKLRPWMQPIFDNLELLAGGRRKKAASRSGKQFPMSKQSSGGYEDLIEQGFVEVEALTYIRGRSLPKCFMIIDEAQNLSAHEVKTIITRAGEGTKIVLTGDPYQIDNPYVDVESNGLVYAAEKLKGQPIVGSVRLVKGERSELAEIAAGLL